MPAGLLGQYDNRATMSMTNILAEANLLDFADALQSLGAMQAVDLNDATDEDLEEAGLKKLQIKRLRRCLLPSPRSIGGAE